MISLLSSSFKIAIASLLVSKIRSLLTVLGIIVGTAAVIILVSVGSGLKELVAGQFASLGANLLMVVPGRLSGGTFGNLAAFTNDGRFRDEDLAGIRHLPGVSLAAADLDEFKPVRFRGKSTTALLGGANEDYLSLFNWGVARGRFFSKAELSGQRKVVVIGEKIRKELFNLDPLGEDLLVGRDRYQIVGALSPKGGFGQFDWDTAVFMPLSMAQRYFGRDTLDMLYFKVKEGYSRLSVSAQVESLLKRRLSEDDFSIVEQGDLFRAADSILSAVTLALGGIAAISLLVGGIGIMNIMLVAVAERTREIGLRKAVGASFNDILWQFLIEAAVVSALGGVLGIILGVGGSLVLGKFLTTSVTLWSILLSFSVSGLVGIIFGLLPAYKAAKLDPVEALRYE